ASSRAKAGAAQQPAASRRHSSRQAARRKGAGRWGWWDGCFIIGFRRLLAGFSQRDPGPRFLMVCLFDYTIPPPRMEAELPEIFPAGKNFSPGLPLGPGLCYNGGKPEREEGAPWPR